VILLLTLRIVLVRRRTGPAPDVADGPGQPSAALTGAAVTLSGVPMPRHGGVET
jgi:hypothetical protein